MSFDRVVDGTNVAKTGNCKGVLRNLVKMMAYLDEHGLKGLFIVSAKLRHDIDDKQGLEELIQQGIIHQAPAGVNDDEFILAYSKEFNAKVISNDQFKDYQDSYPEIKERRVPFMIVEETVVLSQGGQG